jgi:hypothetical protein
MRKKPEAESLAADFGWIKLYRSLMDDPVWTTATAEQKAVLVTVLLLASHESRQWAWNGRKFEILPGQCVTSLASIASRAGVSIQSVRSALARFEKLDFLTSEATKTGRLISIRNWSVYQGEGDRPNKAANRDPTKTQHLSRRKEGKKKEEEDLFTSCGELILANPSPPPGLSLPLNDGSAFPIEAGEVLKWQQLYPAVDVVAELRKMCGWLDANPKNRKTRQGIKRFIVSWLSRAQDKAPAPGPGRGGGGSKTMDALTNLMDA